VLLPDLFYRVEFDAGQATKCFTDPVFRQDVMTRVMPTASHADVMRDTEALLAARHWETLSALFREIGCGPGVLTAALAARGARVVAVDASAAMLQAAVHRAPSASFTLADARTFVPAIRVDTILISFLMHELPASDWPSVLRRLATGLEPSGRLVIADHATPSTTAGLAWRSVLRRVETRQMDEWLNADLSALVAGAGLTVQEDVPLAGGRVRLMIACR
jgi:SAM-dependent methyltransferase